MGLLEKDEKALYEALGGRTSWRYMFPGESTPPRPSRPPGPPSTLMAGICSPPRFRLRSRERDSDESRAYQLRAFALPALRRPARGGPALPPAPLRAVSMLLCLRRPWSALAMFSRTSRALREGPAEEEGTEADAGEEYEAEPDDDERARFASLEKALLVLCGRPWPCAWTAGAEVGGGWDAERNSESAMA